MTFTRSLKFGMSGADVRFVKELLLRLGCYGPAVASIQKDSFGSDTRAAVRRFQTRCGLEPDGVVGPLTYAALQSASAAGIVPAPEPEAERAALGKIPENIGAAAAKAIAASLTGAGDIRTGIVLDALSFAFDRSRMRALPISLYIRGGNLYNRDLSKNVITLTRIASGAKRQPQYYDGGRREMMERTVRACPSTTGADCSGGVVGLLRHAGVVSGGFDLSADGFAQSKSCRHVSKAALLPADVVHKPGHVGLYAGGGYVVEWMGGAYGCQLTALNERRGYSFVNGKTARMGAWTGFLRPAYYGG